MSLASENDDFQAFIHSFSLVFSFSFSFFSKPKAHLHIMRPNDHQEGGRKSRWFVVVSFSRERKWDLIWIVLIAWLLEASGAIPSSIGSARQGPILHNGNTLSFMILWCLWLISQPFFLPRPASHFLSLTTQVVAHPTKADQNGDQNYSESEGAVLCLFEVKP